jgi:hypothetical protein
MSGQLHAHATLLPGKGRLMGTRAGLDAVVKRKNPFTGPAVNRFSFIIFFIDEESFLTPYDTVT